MEGFGVLRVALMDEDVVVRASWRGRWRAVSLSLSWWR
jgi:hypothetical protein